jgi:thiol-disulfide isomerase/thioredoxin
MKSIILLLTSLQIIPVICKEVFIINKTEKQQVITVSIFDFAGAFVHSDTLSVNSNTKYSFKDEYFNSTYYKMYLGDKIFQSNLNKINDTLIIEEDCIYRKNYKNDFSNIKNLSDLNIGYKSTFNVCRRNISYENAILKFVENCKRFDSTSNYYYLNVGFNIFDIMQFCNNNSKDKKDLEFRLIKDLNFRKYLILFFFNYNDDYLFLNYHILYKLNVIHYLLSKDDSLRYDYELKYNIKYLVKSPKQLSLFSLVFECMKFNSFTNSKMFDNYKIDTNKYLLNEDLPKLKYLFEKYKKPYHTNILECKFVDSLENEILFKDIISNYSERYIIGEYWATWCAPCLKEIPYINQIDSVKENRNYRIIKFCEVSDKSNYEESKAASLKLFYDKTNHYFDNGKKSIIKLLQVQALPFTFLYDKKKECSYYNFANEFL